MRSDRPGPTSWNRSLAAAEVSVLVARVEWTQAAAARPTGPPPGILSAVQEGEG